MTEHAASRLRLLASPHRTTAGSPGGRAAALLLRLGCTVLLAWIGYIHLHLWVEGYRHIPANGPLFLLDAVAGFSGAQLANRVHRTSESAGEWPPFWRLPTRRRGSG